MSSHPAKIHGSQIRLATQRPVWLGHPAQSVDSDPVLETVPELHTILLLTLRYEAPALHLPSGGDKGPTRHNEGPEELECEDATQRQQ